MLPELLDNYALIIVCCLQGSSFCNQLIWLVDENEGWKYWHMCAPAGPESSLSIGIIDISCDVRINRTV